MEKKSFEISWGSLWRVFFFILLATVMLFGRKTLLGLFLALVISSGLEFMVNFLEKRGLPRTLGVVLIFFLGLLLVVITIYAIIPLVLIDLNTVFVGVNKLTQNSWFGPLITFKTAQSFNAFISKVSSEFLAGGGSPIGTFSDIIGGVILSVSVIFSAFYLSLNKEGVEHFISSVFPPSHEEAALRIYTRSRRRIGIWFRTQILLSIIMAVLVIATLLILKVRYAFLLGILAGVFELVPFVGPILSGSAATLSALTTSPTLALYTLIAFVIIHQLENHVLVPLVIGHSVGLHPVIVIVALLIGIEVGGFLGVLVSVPAAVVIQEVVDDWAGKKRPREVTIV